MPNSQDEPPEPGFLCWELGVIEMTLGISL
jgi:hypothetical protein